MLGVEQQYGSARYTASTGSTTSDTTSGGGCGTSGAGGSSSAGGVRRLRLSRPAAGHYSSRAPFGFTLRGGKEHGTGFFVTHVEPGSEAYNQGLKIGDQVVRVNGYRISDALHKEMLSLIASLNYLKIKVRNVGMVPVKEKPQDPLTWRLVADAPASPMIHRHSPPLSTKIDGIRDVKLTLNVPSRSKLGCGICKGPDWKPGIFVQFTKENGLAREAGLRPGDQIMQCNGIDFREIQFSDAVNVMKQSRKLDLWVRTGSGMELFPGESSGYNSSASSATGDQSPSSTEHKRLSIVKEESMDLEDRLSQLDKGKYKMRTWEHRNFEWERDDLKEMDGDYSEYNESNAQRKKISDRNGLSQNRTIINLSEKGTTIQNNYVVTTIDSDKILNGHRSTTPIVTNDKKTVVVDVHRSEEEFRADKDNITNISCHIEQTQTVRKVSASSVISMSNSTSSSLSSAITQELQRRAERMKSNGSTISLIEETRKNKVLRDVNDEKKQQHEALMDEFRKAHKRMFANNSSNNNLDSENKSEESQEKSNRNSVFSELNTETARSTGSTIIFAPPDQPYNAYNGTTTTSKSQNALQQNARSPVGAKKPVTNGSAVYQNGIKDNAKQNGGLPNGNAQNGVTQNGIKSNGLNVASENNVNNQNGSHSPDEITKRPLARTINQGAKANGATNIVQRKSFKPPGQPPPPPPMPSQDYNAKQADVISNGKPSTLYIKPKAPPPPPVKKTQNGFSKPPDNIPDRPPATPTPDYDTSSLIKVISKPKLIKTTSDAVEMESLESFKLTNPSSPTPRPPNTYFMKQPSGTLTMKKANPLVSVTIGEYPSNTFRKQPSKLEFLNANGNQDVTDGRTPNDEPVGSRLQSELAQTLSRSNLKKKTDSELKANGEIYKSDISSFDSAMIDRVEPNANFHKRYGQNILPQPPSICIPKVPVCKSLSHNILSTTGGDNRITIKTFGNGKNELAKTESLPQGGILKNSTPMFLNERNASYKLSTHQKSIKFGQTTTVIGDADQPVPVNY